MKMYYIYLIIAIVIILFFAGVRIVRPTSRGLIETMGKYTKYAQPGFHWVRKCPNSGPCSAS